MNIKYFSIIICFIFLLACNNNHNAKNTAELKIDSLAVKDSLFKAELIRKEGVKAIGNINFYISEKEFEKQKDIYLKSLSHKNEFGFDEYSIGEFSVLTVSGNFFNDSLFSIQIRGIPISYDEYNSKMPKQFETLMSILVEKYGNPYEKKELPEWNAMPNNSTWILAQWHLGFKDLLMYINCGGSTYSIDFCYYVPELADRRIKIEEEKSIQINKKAVEKL